MFTKTIQIRLPEPLYNQVARAAEADGRTLSNLVRLVLHQAVTGKQEGERKQERKDEKDK